MNRLARLPLIALALVAAAGCGSAPAGTNQPTALPPTTAVAPATVVPTTAAPTAEPAADLAALSDEFDDGATLGTWQDFAVAEDWPNWVAQIDVDGTTPGALTIVPNQSGWFEDYHGIFLFKTVSGDFDVSTRVQATGKQTPLPTFTYSLAGLMARAPRSEGSAGWKTDNENWLFITTGYGDNHPRRQGKQQIETKTTTNSSSSLTLMAVPTGWIDLRIIRTGNIFLMLYRPPEQPWQLSRRFVRPDLPETLQVGINAYSSNEDESGQPVDTYNRRTEPPAGDMIATIDYVRYQTPIFDQQQREGVISGKLPTKDMLALLNRQTDP